MDRAIEWIGKNKGEIAIGTVVIVGGVAFVLAISPLGWLVLVPVGVAAAT
jgi:hypothetical protein